MSTPIALGNVVGKAVDVLLIGVIPLHGHLDRDAIFPILAEVKYLGMDGSLVLIQILNEGTDTTLVVEMLLPIVPLIFQTDGNTRVEEGELAQTLGQDFVVELGIREDGRARPETNFSTRLVRVTDLLERCNRITQIIGLLVDMTLTTNGQQQLVRKRVHHRNPYPVQTAGNLVGVIVKLTASVQHGHDDLSCRNALFFMNIDRNTPAIVAHRDGAVSVNDNTDIAAVARQRLVDGVIHHFEDHVMQTRAIVGITDIHTGTLANRVQPLQYLDTRGVVSIFTHLSLSLSRA